MPGTQSANPFLKPVPKTPMGKPIAPFFHLPGCDPRSNDLASALFNRTNRSGANDTVGNRVVLPADPNSLLELAIHAIDGASPLRHAWHQVLLWAHESQVPPARRPASGFPLAVPAVRAVCPARGRHRFAERRNRMNRAVSA